MKTPQEIATAVIRESGYSDFPKTTSSEPLFARDVAVEAIEADRAQLVEAIEKLLDETKPPRVFDEEDWERQGNNGAIEAVLDIIRGESK